MNDYKILNLIPTYEESPISLELLDNQVSQIVNKLTSDWTDKKFIVLNQEDKRVQKILPELKAIPEVTIVPVKEKNGFVFGNKSAIVKVIGGEKPLPTGIYKELPVYTVEELLGADEKSIYIDGKSKKKNNYTIPKHLKPRQILEERGMDKAFKGIYFGYPMGLMIDSSQLDMEIEVTTDYVYIFDETQCILDELVKIVGRYVKESCGRCVYGYEGITQINMILTDMTQKKGKQSDVELLMDLCSVMKTQSLCEIGRAAAVTILTAFQNFREEIEEHIIKKTCKAAVCQKYVTYHILPDLCTGCTDCLDACDDEAIQGKKKFIHVIDLDECVQCGNCINACDEGAIITAGANKPKGPKKPIPCK